MRVAVLNGVNLDVLHRRDPALYGGISLNQLETRIYSWALELELPPEAAAESGLDRQRQQLEQPQHAEQKTRAHRSLPREGAQSAPGARRAGAL